MGQVLLMRIETHMKVGRRVLAYLNGTANHSIVYHNMSNNNIHVYTRAFPPDHVLGFAGVHYATDKDDQKV